MIKCEIDGIEFKNGGVLARHLKNSHLLTYREYFHKYILKLDDIPKCKCGCGIEMKWTSVGYKEYVKGHYSRVHNNWGHNVLAQLKSAETRRQQYASGERQTWNVGLTKETDERVKICGMGRSLAFTDDVKKEYGKRMSKNRLNGTIPTMRGSRHSQWIDGRSNISILTYNDVRLYKEWKYPILVRDGFKCVECGISNGKLHIHHDKEYMSDIIKKHLVEVTEDMLKDFEIKKKISDSVVNYHITNKVSGVTLCGKCHEKYHPSLNFG